MTDSTAKDVSSLLPTTDRMRALVATGIGGTDCLEVREMPLPVVVHSDVLVRVFASGINPIETKTRAGSGMAAVVDHPFVLGGEFAGVVVKAPFELAEFQPGDEVWGMLLTPHYQGAQAEYVSVPLMSLAHKPRSLDWAEAGAVPLAALTAWWAVVEAARVHTGQRMLIHAGAGGVGHFAVQLAKFYGAQVVTTASAHNHEWLRKLGADQVIDYRNERFEKVIAEPVDVVIDLIGNVHDNTGTRSLSVLRDGGLIINVPTGSWPTMHEEVAAAGRGLRASVLKLSPEGRILRTLAQLFDQGDLRVHVDAVFGLDEAAAAHERIEQGHTRGKLVFDLRR
ncbi:NADP-dependent oxidoreductase [uncultured Gulosibacter sp.]|uniref:NADP-dependent oxidoreductase n=1 Tax=uncultured Gulosibacter sp. TaxID=1339167 RepID=UPI00288AE1A1|nr:NADP-dependent oxidoreductase [uncultured Gulosibacter sp.]